MRPTEEQIYAALLEFTEEEKKRQMRPLDMIELNPKIVSRAANVLTSRLKYPIIVGIYKDNWAMPKKAFYEGYCLYAYPLPEVNE